ncbi:FAD-dependent monooxygenase [Corallococcus exercitus]|uniref:FAD-dependent monooxygenase n=1 Tax=Corallococcus exercitus TaxID=2316736 RepID=UPI0034634398
MGDTLVYDVIIAGAGPVGLFLACELRLAKRSVLVLERLEDPHSPLKRFPFGRGAHPRWVAGPGRADATQPRFPRARSHPPRPHRYARRRDLLR